jgi:hypothetical protein
MHHRHPHGCGDDRRHARGFGQEFGFRHHGRGRLQPEEVRRVTDILDRAAGEIERS